MGKCNSCHENVLGEEDVDMCSDCSRKRRLEMESPNF